MHNIDAVYFFIFVFATLVTLKNLTRFISTLLKDSPEKLIYTNKELIILGMSVSYILTYLLKL